MPPVPALSIAQALADATERLAAVTETPRLDAEILLAHALGCSRANLLTRLRETCDCARFDPLIERRLDYEPIAYITGEWEFFSISFKVRAPFLVPRPETEHLVETVLDFIGQAPARILEIGTGTGCVAVAIAKNAPRAYVTATDIHPGALELAAENAREHGVADRIAFRLGDLFDAVEPPCFDVVCSNPPYVEETDWPNLSPTITRHEDPGALLAGPDGLDAIRRIVGGAGRFLRPGGLLAFELGMCQDRSVEKLMHENCYPEVQWTRDLAGIRRIASAQWHGPGPFTQTGD